MDVSVSQELAWSVVLNHWTLDYFECSLRHNALKDWHEKQVVIKPEPGPVKKTKRFWLF